MTRSFPGLATLLALAPLAPLAPLLSSCPGHAEDPGAPPAAPDQDDPDFDVTPPRAWNLIANGATPGHDELQIEVIAPADVEQIRPWLADEPGDLLDGNGATFTGVVDISGLPPGQHQVLLQADGGEVAFAAVPFLRSHPLYVLTSVDWDRSDIEGHELDWHLALHQDHEHLRITQFVGAYTFTDPAVSAERTAELVDWLDANRQEYDDEVGLHIHAYCHFVEYAGVTCRHEPSFVYDAGDASGYTVLSSAYTEDEYTTLVQTADALFEEHGLGKATSFRAGGWIADEGVLRALASVDYVADTSSVNWACLEEWDGYQNNALWEFITDTWSEIDATSQPYYPSQEDAGVPGDPAIPILEVPDNACLADYIDAEQMIEVLEANWAGEALEEPKVWSIGFHNVTKNAVYFIDFRPHVEGALDHADRYLAVNDEGPLVYGTLSEMALVWPSPR